MPSVLLGQSLGQVADDGVSGAELLLDVGEFPARVLQEERATVKQQYAESLYFLDAPLADATITQDQREHTIDSFLTGTLDETEIQVKNVTLDDLKAPPYKAVVEFEKVHNGYANRQERSRDTYVAQITFVLRGQIPNAMIPVNPLGLTITYFRVDQAFK